MLYNEFIEGTGCKDNATNYRVYKNLEIMYMNSDMSKAEIYEYGKKLVDNSKSEAELKAEQEAKDQIEELKETVESLKNQIEKLKEDIEVDKIALQYQDDSEFVKYLKREIRFKRSCIKARKEEIRDHRNKMSALKSLFAIQ